MLLFIVGCSKTDPKTISMAAAASRGHAVAAYRIESQADFGSYEVTQVWAFKRSNSNKYPYIIVEFSGPHISEEPRFKLDQEGLIYLGLVGYTDNSFREVWQSPTGIPDTLVVERNLEDAFAGVFSVDRNEPSSRF
ncbi:MAG: hypothetical protein AAFU85_21650 [Planctomycetota bacterium]